TFMHKILWVK
ncbi:acetyltransferase family protein, partial [Vibrio parahaemolyticus V-223/04]